MLKIIDESGVPQDRITMICFGKEVCARSKELRPELKTLWLTSYKEENPITAEALIEELKSCNADGVDIYGIPSFINDKFIAAVKAAGFYFAVWTIDDENRAKELADAGVDSITSNRAAAVMNALRL